MTSPSVLLLGGHGKVSLLMTPLMLAKSWKVTSVVRNADHRDEILALGKGHKGSIDVLVESLEDVKSEADAKLIIDRVNPTYVVWSAGAGGKGGPSRTHAVDQEAAKQYISASVESPGVTKFLMISYIASRKNRPPWWSDVDWTSAQHVNTSVLPHYFKAKVEADEHLVAVAEKRRKAGDETFQAINLRPGTLTDEPATGKVKLGKTGSRGKVSRADVAAVAVGLLERDDTRGWFDLLEGEHTIEEAINAVVTARHDGIEGENLERIYSRVV